MYLRKIRPRTTCLYSAASMWRAACRRPATFLLKPRLASLPFLAAAFFFAGTEVAFEERTK